MTARADRSPRSCWSARRAPARPPSAGCSPSGWASRFRDTDADVEAAAGKPIAEIFVDDGEAHFRALERAAVRAALTEHDGVLALGGGAVLDAEHPRRCCAGHRVVFLQVGLRRRGQARRPRRRAGRCCCGNVRAPVQDAAGGAPPALRRGRHRRRVDTDGRTPEDVADDVAPASLEARALTQ